MQHIFSKIWLDVQHSLEVLRFPIDFYISLSKLWLFIKVLVYSNQEYENVTTSANNLVLWQKLRISKGKSPQNLPTDGYMSNSWEFTLFSWQESVKRHIVLNLSLFFSQFFKKSSIIKQWSEIGVTPTTKLFFAIK